MINRPPLNEVQKIKISFIIREAATYFGVMQMSYEEGQELYKKLLSKYRIGMNADELIFTHLYKGDLEE